MAGEIITYSITLTNNGPDAATGITTVDLLPAEVAYDSHSNGTYVATSGVWSVANLAVNSSTTLYINAQVLAPPTLSAILHNPAPPSDNPYGISVAGVGSNRIAVGDTQESMGDNHYGRVHLFDSVGNLAATIPNPPAFYDYHQFGRSVAGLGSDRIIVGAPEYNFRGRVLLFGETGAVLADIANPTAVLNDIFGRSVAAVGSDLILVGAPKNNVGATDAGSAYIYNTNGLLLVTITNPAPAIGDSFGSSVAGLGSDRVIVGADLDDAGAADAGSVYIYDTNGTRLVTITNPAPAIGDKFGSSVASLGSDLIIVGSCLDDAGASNAGSTYIYDASGALLITITNPVPASDDNFGFSVAGLGSDRLVVGAHQDDAGASNAGSIYLFDSNGNLLDTFANPDPSPEDFFGYSVASLGSNSVVVGSVNNEEVYVFDLAPGGGIRFDNIAAKIAQAEADPVATNNASLATVYVGTTNDRVAFYIPFSIQTAYGTSTPPSGNYMYPFGSEVTVSVSPASFTNSTQKIVPAGWTMVGNEPSSGVGTQAVVIITNSASFQWLWAASYLNTNRVNVDTTNDVLNDLDGLLSLREAVIDANAASATTEITLSNATYRLTIGGAGDDAALTGDLDITNDMRVVGVDALPATVDASALNDRVFHVASNVVAYFSNLVIRGGNAGTNFGGGLLCRGITTVDKCTIMGNSGGMGGGLYNSGTSLLIVNSRIVNNSCPDGANGVTGGQGGRPGGEGGGIYSFSGAVSIRSTLIQSNFAGSGGVGANDISVFNAAPGGAGGNGGGIVSMTGLLTIVQSAVVQNKAGHGGSGGGGAFGAPGGPAGSGGGILALGFLVISNSTLSGNVAGSGGGGGNSSAFGAAGPGGGAGGTAGAIFTVLTSHFFNVTIISNAPGPGGGGGSSGGGAPNGISGSPGTIGGIAGAGPVVMVNSILANNAGSNGSVTSLGFNLINTNPLVGPLAQNGGPTPTHALLLGSPALNKGNPAVTTGLDQRGFPRVRGRAVDIGAFEEQNPDEDLDQIPDEWEMQYGLNPTNAADANSQGDGDPFNNLQEFFADTNPTNSASYHQIIAITNTTDAFVAFPSSTARLYRLEFSTNLLQPVWQTVLSNVVGQAGMTSVPDTNTPAFKAYRVGVGLP